MRHKSLYIQAAALLVCLGTMAAHKVRADDHTDVALVKQRQDQVDHHLSYNDGRLDAITTRLDTLTSDLSRMEGIEYAAWAIVSVLVGGSVVVQFKGRRRSD